MGTWVVQGGLGWEYPVPETNPEPVTAGLGALQAGCSAVVSAFAEDDASLCQIKRGHLKVHGVADGDADEMVPQFT